jgi:hypothetical protein
LVVFWESVVEPLLEASSPRVIVEVGVARGATTVKLLELSSRTGCTVHAIDPAPQPSFDVDLLQRQHGDRFVFHKKLSLEVLPRLAGVDAALIDGDHNWFTVYRELKALEAQAEVAGGEPPLTMIHDIGWPYGRRDGYYDPDTIPPEYRQPHRKAGIVRHRSELAENGGVNPRLDNATTEGTPRNGVRTAIEDFLATSECPYVFRSVVGFNGLGILVSHRRLEESGDLQRRLEELDSPTWLHAQCERLEEARLDLQARLKPLLRKTGG